MDIWLLVVLIIALPIALFLFKPALGWVFGRLTSGLPSLLGFLLVLVAVGVVFFYILVNADSLF